MTARFLALASLLLVPIVAAWPSGPEPPAPLGGRPAGLIFQAPVYGLPGGTSFGPMRDIVGVGGRYVEPQSAYPSGARGLDHELNPDSPAALIAPTSGHPFVDPPSQVSTYTSIDQGHSATMLLHSGQEMLEVVDLHIPGRDPLVDLSIRRRHVTGVNLDESAFGNAWAFNFSLD